MGISYYNCGPLIAASNRLHIPLEGLAAAMNPRTCEVKPAAFARALRLLCMDRINEIPSALSGDPRQAMPAFLRTLNGVICGWSECEETQIIGAPESPGR